MDLFYCEFFNSYRFTGQAGLNFLINIIKVGSVGRFESNAYSVIGPKWLCILTLKLIDTVISHILMSHAETAERGRLTT